MSSWRFILRSLSHHWRINAAVALGAAAATAVLTGALLVGSSVRGSLTQITHDRLGQIDEVLLTDRFFRLEMIEDLSRQKGFKEDFQSATPAILFPSGAIEFPNDEGTRRAANVTVVGCDKAFWDLGDPRYRPVQMPGEDEIVINQPLADELGAKVGDLITLRLAKPDQVPAESPLGRKSGRTSSLPRLKVVEIVAAEGLGRFSLRANQNLPHNAYVSIESLQSLLDQEGKVNAIFIANQQPVGYDAELAQKLTERLASLLSPNLEDYGLKVKQIHRTFVIKKGADKIGASEEGGQEEVVFDYYSVTSDRMVFQPATERAAQRAFESWQGQATLTYLANSIVKVEEQAVREEAATDEKKPQNKASIPYSMVSAIDSNALLGPLVDAEGKPIGPLADDQIVLNSWAAADLQAEVGDKIRLTYYEPETTHGQALEKSQTFTLSAIVPITEPSKPYERSEPNKFDQRPTLANDPDLTPEVKGVTDQDSIENWDAPFPFDYRLMRDQDDEYWKNHRTTPKAFVSLAAGKKLWSSRFGQTTSFRIAAQEGVDQAAIEKRLTGQLKTDGTTLGFDFLPVKYQGLAASSGTTPFDGLFLGLSFFIIAAALMLTSLLFRLGVEQRATEIGILLAVGVSRRLSGRLFAAEGFIVAATGGMLGVAAGIGYAWLMLVGLRNWWVGAVSTPFLHLHVPKSTLLLGYVLGVLASVLTIAWSIRQMRLISVRRLLSGQSAETSILQPQKNRWETIVAGGLFLSALGLAVLATQLGGEAQAGSFVGSGAAILSSLLLLIRRHLRNGTSGRIASTTGSFALLRLAQRSIARNPGRSTMTIGLMAAASFLIVAMSSFQLSPSESGYGGFDLFAESSLPIFHNLNDPQGREELLAEKADSLKGASIYSFRLRPGDNASCSNLYQSHQPQILGTGTGWIDHFDSADQPFSWAGSSAQSEQEQANPWRLLKESSDPNAAAADDAVPVVLDKSTAMYSLHLYRGIGEEFTFTYDERPIKFRVAGLLSNSVLQGSLLIGEADFMRLFPKINGYRFFMIDPVQGQSEAVAEVLEDTLSDQGFDVRSSSRRMEDLLAVQNTYLKTFQSLGALGLLLGTFGLATVQLRNILERRSELALLRAIGFRRVRLAQIVMLENILLLLGGLATGSCSALLAVLPHMFFGGASAPLRDLSVMLGVVLVVGIVTGIASVRATLKAPLLAALRGE